MRCVTVRGARAESGGIGGTAELPARQHGGLSAWGERWARLHPQSARRTPASTNQHGAARGGSVPPVDPTAPDWSQDPLRLTVETAVVGPTPPVTWYTKGS